MATQREDTTIRIAAVDATKQAFDSVGRNLKQLDSSIVGLRSGFAGLAVVAGGGLFAQFTKSSINSIAALDDLSEKTGLTVEFLSQLEGVATIGGHSLDALSSSAAKLTKSIGEAQAGNKEILNAFEAIGISVDDLRSKKIDELFLDVATKIARTDNAALAAAVSTKLLGRSAQEQLPFLRDLAEQGLGNVRVTTAQAAAAEKLEKEFGKLRLAVRDAGNALALDILPWLTRMVEEFNEGIKAAGGFFDALFLLGTLPVASNASAFDIGEAIKGFERDLEQLKAGREQLTKLPGDYAATIAKVDVDMARILQRVEFLRSRQAAAARRDFQGPTQPEAGFDIDASKLNENAKKAQDALSKLFEQRAKQIASGESALATERLKILEQFHAEGLIAEDEYWDSRFSIQREAINKEIAAIDVEIANRRKGIADQFSGEDASRDVKRWSAERIGAEKEIEEALERRAIAERKLGSIGVENELARTKAAREFGDAITELAARRLEIEGRTEEALAVRQERQNRAIRAQLAANSDPAGLNQLKRLEAAEVLQLRFNELKEQGANITSRLAIEEERIQNAQRVGAIGELESLRQTGDARERTVEQLRAIAEQLDSIAAQPGFEKQKLQAEQFRAAMDSLATQADLLKQKFATIGVDALSDAMTDVILRTKDASEAFADMARAILADIARILAQDFARRLVGGSGSTVGLLGLFAGSGSAATISAEQFAGAGFATGGSFTVGGSGGTDTTPVAFRATRGERVTIETPSQQRNRTAMSVTNVYNIDSRSDRAAIVAEIRASERRTIAQVQDLERRGQLTFGS